MNKDGVRNGDDLCDVKKSGVDTEQYAQTQQDFQCLHKLSLNIDLQLFA